MELHVSFTVNMKVGKIVGALVAALIIIPIVNPTAIVSSGHRGVVTEFGKVDMTPLGEGLHFRVPVMQKVHLMNVQIQKGEGEGDAASKDLQSVHTKVALNYHIDPSQVSVVYRDIGADVGDNIIVPAVQEAVKAATALFTAEELITRRQEVRNKIRELLVDRLIRHGVTIDEFSIVNFSFSKSFTEAVEAKTTAEQHKLKADRDLTRIRVEAEQKIATARAEAESLRLQKQEITPELVKLRETENQREAIRKWNGVLPSVTGGAIPMIGGITPSSAH
jgi:prohibitin 2